MFKILLRLAVVSIKKSKHLCDFEGHSFIQVANSVNFIKLNPNFPQKA